MSQKNFVSFGDAETLMSELASAIADKVDKVNGKDLSTNDYSNADKAIVDGVTSALASKADISDVPTKTSDLSNDNGFINNLVNDLANYYKKSETYSQTEIDARIAAITTLDIQAVNTLPTEDISTTTIYLVPKQTPSSQDVKDEYINLDGTTSGWEHIGTTEIDLSNYVTTSDLTTALQSYVPASQLTANDTPFRFGYDSNTGKYGYILNEGGADTVIPFKTTGTRSGAITSNGTYTANTDISKDGYESVVVSVPNSVQTKTITAGTSNTTVSPDSGYIGMSSVTVKPTPSQEKSVTSSRSAQTVTPDSGKLLSKVTVNALAPTGTYTASSRGNSLDMGATSNYRYVNTNSVPNSNSGTYSFPANDTGGTKDLGATNSYRYVNAENVYNKGKADGGSGKVTISVANITTKDLKSGANVTFSATNGAVYAVSFGGRDSVPTSAPSLSGATNLGYAYGNVDGRGNLGSLLICQATSNSVTISISSREVCVVVTRVTS